LGLKYETTSIISHAETQDLTFDETDQQNHLCGFRVLNTPLMLTKIWPDVDREMNRGRRLTPLSPWPPADLWKGHRDQSLWSDQRWTQRVGEKNEKRNIGSE